MEFSGKRILVTGGTRGIGRAIAISLAARGADVIVLGRSEPSGDCPSESNISIKFLACDLANWESTCTLVRSLGQLDGLVNNAGVAHLETVGSVTEAALLDQFRVNLFAAINVSQTAAEAMPPGASIVNVSSQTSFVTLPGHIGYAATKAALDSATRSLAAELGPRRIRVNSVNPGVVMTDMGRLNWSDPAKAKPMLARVPLQRFVQVGEVVDVVEFLLSDRAAMINGVALPLEGGVAINQL